MAFPRNSLRAFLSHAKSTLRSALTHPQKLTLVVGNESADLDSLTSSLLYAYIRSSFLPQNAFAPLYIPITNLPAKDLSLRPEFSKVYEHANIDASHLITLDDLAPFAKLREGLNPKNTQWILVDHNKLQGVLGEIYGSRVCGVIDHHDEEHAVPQDTGSEPRIVVKSGSCTSLVVSYLRGAWDQLSSSALSAGAAHGQGDSLADDSAVSGTWDAQVAKLALASILIDTANLTAKEKVESVDIEAVEYIEAKIALSPRDAVRYNRQAYFAEIDTAKKDLDSLSLNDILRKDYKQWSEGSKTLGISSVVKPLSYLVLKAHAEQSQSQEQQEQQKAQKSFVQALRTFAKERNLDIYALMTAYTSPSPSSSFSGTEPSAQFRRELLLYTPSTATITAAETFTATATKKLGLEERALEGGHGIKAVADEEEGDEEVREWIKVWQQGELGSSRKVVGPLLRRALMG